MKKNVLIFSVLLCIFMAGCSKAGKSENKQNVEAKIEQTEKSVNVTGSDVTLTVSDATEEIVIKGNNNQVSTENSKDNSNK